jgi:hypothetical protein
MAHPKVAHNCSYFPCRAYGVPHYFSFAGITVKPFGKYKPAFLLLTYSAKRVNVHRMVRKLDHKTATEIGRLGAKQRNKNLSAKRRKEIADKAIAARWAKKMGKAKPK